MRSPASLGPGQTLKVLAHYQNLAPWRRPAETRGGRSARVWIEGEEVADVYARFADVQLTREPAIEISGPSGVPMVVAMAKGSDWNGHMPGPMDCPAAIRSGFRPAGSISICRQSSRLTKR